jgi:hypothetical protein
MHDERPIAQRRKLFSVKKKKKKKNFSVFSRAKLSLGMKGRHLLYPAEVSFSSGTNHLAFMFIFIAVLL